MIECPETKKNDAPQHVLDTYTLALEECFGGPELNYDIWDTSYVWGPEVIINDEEQVYIDTDPNSMHGPLDPIYTGINPFSFGADGQLIITAEPLPQDIQDATGRTYSSGVITTRDSLCFTGGYTEVCLKVPCDADGSWLAAWLLNCMYYNNADAKNQAENGGVGNDKFNPEIDFEWVNGPNSSPECIKNAYHYFTGDRLSTTNYSQWRIDGSNFIEFDPNTGQVFSQFNVYEDCDGASQFLIPEVCDPDFCLGFHTVGIDWCPNDYIHYYIDGQLVNCINGPDDLISDQAMYFLLNFAVGGSFPFGGQPGGTAANKADPTTYPASMEVEYVRIYTK